MTVQISMLKALTYSLTYFVCIDCFKLYLTVSSGVRITRDGSDVAEVIQSRGTNMNIVHLQAHTVLVLNGKRYGSRT